MWIFCCGMPRSGSTLQFQITAKLVEDAGLGKRIEWCEHFDFPKIREKYMDYSGWKVFKVHIPTDEMLAEFRKQNAMGVYIFRDLRDSMASNIRKKKIESDPDTRKKLIKRWSTNWVQYYNTWAGFSQVLVSKYEQVVSNLAGEVQRIAGHLGIPLKESETIKIGSEFTLNKQRERIEALNKDNVSCDPHSLLHMNHIHSGEIGGWENFLTHEEVLLIEGTATSWLLKNGYPLSGFKEETNHGQ